jgi:hypothetical protein
MTFSPQHLAQGGASEVIFARCRNGGDARRENLESNSRTTKSARPKLTRVDQEYRRLRGETPRPRQSVAQRAAANNVLPRLLKRGRKILTGRMDKLMIQFRERSRLSHAEYRRRAGSSMRR